MKTPEEILRDAVLEKTGLRGTPILYQNVPGTKFRTRDGKEYIVNINGQRLRLTPKKFRMK